MGDVPNGAMNSRMRFPHHRTARLMASAALAIVLGAAAGACTTTRGPETTGSIGQTSPSRSEADWRREADALASRYRANPGDPKAAIEYAHALRMTGQRTQAAAVLEQASIRHPRDKAVLGAYGRALADIGNFKQALALLGKAHTPDQPDWRVLSAQGAVLDQMAQHEEAQRYYASALRIQPNDPSVLSNLGLSYALSKQLPLAEQTLRQAASQRPVDPRVRQNLALVVGLQGRFAEAEAIARADLPPAEAAANVVYLREMLEQQQRKDAESKPLLMPRQAKPKPRRRHSGPPARG